MEFFRTVLNPWAQQIFIGVSWDLLWASAFVGAAFIVAHAVYAHFRGEKEEKPSEEVLDRAALTIPEKIQRHTAASRVSHWILAASVLTLLVTSFVPILGLKFPWVTVHWIAGLVLAAYTVFHAIHATARRTLHTMWISREELKEGWARVKLMAGRPAREPRKPGKWPLENKLFHHLTMVAALVVVGTGLLMMLRIDTPFTAATPYILSDATWGIVFVLHGAAAVLFVATTMMHIYFAIRPENLFLTWSMIRGKISRRDYLTHHDPERWPVPVRTLPIRAVGGTAPQQPTAPASGD